MVRTMHSVYGRKCFLLLFILPILFSIRCSEKVIHDCKMIEYSTPPPHLWYVNESEELICIHGYNGTSIWAIWSEVELIATAKKGQVIKFIKGRSCKEVSEMYANKSSWIPSFPSFFSSNSGGGNTSVMASPYGENCFAVYADTPTFSLQVLVYKVKLLYPIMMIAGMLIFYNADDISRNVLFYYTSGVSVGMVLALFLVIFIMSRLIPQRGVGYAFLIGGSSFVLYVLQHIKNQFTSEAIEGNKIFYCYFVFAGLISFLYCYYRGPVRSERGYDILRWCLQSFALFLVYYGIRCEQISLTFVIILVATRWIALQAMFSYIVTRRWIPYRLRAFFFKPRLLTMEEYEREGREETVRALKELREYCESPDCSTWKTVSSLKSPKRFASFISDGEHITEDEQQHYDEPSFDATPFMTSDEDSDIDLAEMNLDSTE